MMLLKMQSHRGIPTSLFEKFTKKIFFKVNNIFSLMQVTNFKNRLWMSKNEGGKTPSISIIY